MSRKNWATPSVKRNHDLSRVVEAFAIGTYHMRDGKRVRMVRVVKRDVHPDRVTANSAILIGLEWLHSGWKTEGDTLL